MKIRNPADGALIADVATDTAASVRRKVERARAAQPAWAAQGIARRLAAIARFRERIVALHETLARTLTHEVGKPIRQSRNELNGLLTRIDFFLAASRRALRREVVLCDPGQKLDEAITHEPLGVIANISAWNYPYFVGSNVFVPALIAGNAVVYKPSEYATLTGLSIAEMLHEAGVPDDVFVPVIGDGAVGAALSRQPVDGVFFTGSYATGAKIAAIAGKRMVKAQLELGGKDPVYVCDDVDVKAAAAGIADGAFYNTGQSCCSVERIYVRRVDPRCLRRGVRRGGQGVPDRRPDGRGHLHRRDHPAGAARRAEGAGRRCAEARRRPALRRPRDQGQGQLVRAHGAHRRRPLNGGDARRDLRPADRHPEGGGDDAAVALMNDSAYGLTAAVYTRDRRRAGRLLARLNAGSVYWNCCDRVSPRLPWSGVGHSGIGLTLSTYGIQTFTRPKAWHLRGG